jgi:hypothetical protein
MKTKFGKKNIKISPIHILLFLMVLCLLLSLCSCNKREHWFLMPPKKDEDDGDDLATFGAMINEVQASAEVAALPEIPETGTYDLVFNDKSCKVRADGVAICTDTAPVYQSTLERVQGVNNPNETLFKLKMGDKYCHADGRGFLYCRDNTDDSERYEIQKDSNNKYYMKIRHSANHSGTLNGKYCGHVKGSDYHGIRCNFDSPPNASPMGQDGWTRDFYSDINLVPYS